MHLRVLQSLGHPKQESIGLPDCAFECFQTAEPDATKWGCSDGGYACLCDVSWFFAGYDDCVRKSCTAVDMLGANVRIQSHCDVLNKRDLSSSSAFAQAATLPGGIATSTLQIATSTSSTPVATLATSTLPITSSTASTPVVTPDGSPVISTQIITTDAAPSAISSTAATAGGATATGTSSSAAASSIHAPSGLSQSAKIGIGLGVPLGVIVLALLGSALYWFGRERGKSRGNHTGLNQSSTEKEDPVDAGAVNPTVEGGELHGQHIVHQPRELAGSPGSVRRELP